MHVRRSDLRFQCCGGADDGRVADFSDGAIPEVARSCSFTRKGAMQPVSVMQVERESAIKANIVIEVQCYGCVSLLVRHVQLLMVVSPWHPVSAPASWFVRRVFCAPGCCCAYPRRPLLGLLWHNG